MNNKKHIILSVLLLLPIMAAPARAGVSKTVIKGGWEMVERGVKYIVKSATRESSEEVSESAAKNSCAKLYSTAMMWRKSQMSSAKKAW